MASQGSQGSESGADVAKILQQVMSRFDQTDKGVADLRTDLKASNEKIQHELQGMVGKVDQLEGNFSQMKKDFEAMSLRLKAVEQAKGRPKWVDLQEQDEAAGMPADPEDVYEEHAGHDSATKRSRNVWGGATPRRSASAGSAHAAPSAGVGPTSGGARPPRSSSAAPSTKKFTIFVGGFGRPLKKKLREDHSKDLLGHLSDSQQRKVRARFEYSAPHYYLDCDTQEVLYGVLDALKAAGPHKWTDPAFDEEQDLYIKRDKTYEQRQDGKFHSHFFAKVKALIAGKPALSQFTPKVVNQKIMLDFGDDQLPLVEFVKESGKTRATANQRTMKKLAIPEDEMESIIRTASAAAESGKGHSE